MKKALVTGAGGFIAPYLIKTLKEDGYWIRGVDIKKHDYTQPPVDEFLLLDLREKENCQKSLSIKGGFDEVFHLAAVRGGIEYTHLKECVMMHDNALININMIHEAINSKVKKFFFSSSTCVYRDMNPGDLEITEEEVYPAFPENEYGWEKLYAERMLLAYGKKYDMKVRIARFHTTYGPESVWEGGREKAPDALCRKAIMAKDGGYLEVWGDGKAVRSFIFVEDTVSGVRHLMDSNINLPTNIGSFKYVTVDKLAKVIIKISGKNLKIKHVKGTVGVKARNFSNKRIHSTGWKPKYSLEEGIKIHYNWISGQIKKKYPNNQ